MKLTRIVLVLTIVFALCYAAFAAEYWVVRGPDGKQIVVEQKPSDASVIIKGPFATRDEADVIISGPDPGGAVAPSTVPPGPPAAPPKPGPPVAPAPRPGPPAP